MDGKSNNEQKQIMRTQLSTIVKKHNEAIGKKDAYLKHANY